MVLTFKNPTKVSLVLSHCIMQHIHTPAAAQTNTNAHPLHGMNNVLLSEGTAMDKITEGQMFLYRNI